MEISKKTIRNIVIGALLCIVVNWLLNEPDHVLGIFLKLWGILLPFAAGAGLAFVLNVPMRAIESKFGFIKFKGLRRVVALLLTFICVILVLAVVLWILIPELLETIESLITQLPIFANGVADHVHKFLEENPEIWDWLVENTNFENFNWSSLVEKLMDWLGNSVTNLLTTALHTVFGLSTGIFNAVVALVFSIYCLCRKETLARQLRRLLYAFAPEKIGDSTVRVMRLTNATFSNFISGQCIEAVILGTLFFITMWIFGMPYKLLISVIISVTALVPIVGAFVGCVIGAFFILIGGDLPQAFWFVIMFLALQQFENNVIYPKVVGKSVGLPGMWVLLAVSLGGELMGVAGMLIMIPAFSVIYALLREVSAARVKMRGIPEDKLMDHPPELGERAHERLFKFKKKKKKTSETSAPGAEESSAKQEEN